MPILTNELCEKRKLIEESELTDYFVRLGAEEDSFFELNISKYTGKKLIREFKEKHFLNDIDYNKMIEESDRYWEEEKNY